jgi:hypothetical protein
MASHSAIPLQNPPKVSIYLRDGDKFYRAVEAANKKLRPHVALVGGREQRLPEAVYTLRYQVDGKRKWEAVGFDPQAAVEQKIRRNASWLRSRLASYPPKMRSKSPPPSSSKSVSICERRKITRHGRRSSPTD